MSFEQLTLDLHWRDDMTLDNFCVGDNHILIDVVQTLEKLAHKLVYIWGGTGTGRTHLLLASCNKFGEKHLNSSYIPLSDFKQLTPEIFCDLDNLPLLCIDDLDAIVGIKAWEEAVFDCFNERMSRNVTTLIVANATPLALDFVLPDLQSRMSSGLLFELKALNDVQKISALQLRAKFLGLDLPVNTAKFLLAHYTRDMGALFDGLKKLDNASLAAQRCLTIPFVKEILDFNCSF